MYSLRQRLTGCVQTAQRPWRASRNKRGATARGTRSEWANRARICNPKDSNNAEVFTHSSLLTLAYTGPPILRRLIGR
jgi:hypothetical protein